MLGIALGVAALIIVLSVMNGFQKEVRDRMLGVISHIEVFALRGGAMADQQTTLSESRVTRIVIGSSTFIAAQALLPHGAYLDVPLVRIMYPAPECQAAHLRKCPVRSGAYGPSRNLGL